MNINVNNNLTITANMINSTGLFTDMSLYENMIMVCGSNTNL